MSAFSTFFFFFYIFMELKWRCWVAVSPNLLNGSQFNCSCTDGGNLMSWSFFPKVVFCQVSRVGIKEPFVLLRNCRQSRSALPGTYSWEGKKEFIASNRQCDINVETINRLSDVCVDPKVMLAQFALNQGCGNPVLKGHNPAGLSVLPRQK